MDKAIDKSTGKEIHADRASLHRSYRCPDCGADCHLRIGESRRPYFAHNAGKASPNCDNYFPGGPHSTGSNGSAQRTPAHRVLNLYLECADTEVSQPAWGLSLLIPESADGIGSVLVLDGYRGRQTLHLRQVTSGGKRVPVIPQTKPYQVDPSGVIDQEYARRLSIPVPGLKKNGCTVFRFSANGGRRLSDDQPLYWGRSYYLLWSDGGKPWWPKFLWKKELRSQGTWHGSLVELPPEPDPQTEAWVDKVLLRQVLQPPVQISVVAPASIGRLEDESLVIPEGDEVVIGVYGERGSALPAELDVLFPGQRVAQKVVLKGSLPVLVSLGPAARGRTEIWLSEDFTVDTSFVTSSMLGILPETVNVRLTVSSPGKNEGTEVPLFSTEASRVLRLVRQGELSLTHIALPERALVTLGVKFDGERVWKEQTITQQVAADPYDESEPHSEFEVRVLAALNDCFLRKELDVRFDCGNFGSVHLEHEAASATVELFGLTPGLRRRVKWLLSVQGRPGEPSVPYLELRELAGFVHLVESRQDRYLLQRFLQRQVWPITVEPHLRQLSRTVRQTLGPHMS